MRARSSKHYRPDASGGQDVLASRRSMATTTTTRTVTLPALVYVLAAFGVVTGSYGALRSIGSAAMFAKPREVYLQVITAQNDGLKQFVDAPALERFCAREADAQYGRRNATLPLAGV